MIRTLRVLSILGAAALAGTGCTGAISGGSDQPGGNKGATGPNGSNNPGGNGPTSNIPGSDPSKDPGLMPPTGDTTKGMLDDSKTVPGAAPLRRLTLFEYKNTVRDLLGITAEQVDIKGFSGDQDSALSGYYRGGALTTANDARNFSGAAEGLATIAQGKLGSLLPCSPVPTAAADQEACVGKFVAQFGLRAFRRPVAKTEADALMGLYKTLRTGEAGASFERAIGLMVSAILQSPMFLYHWELGPNAPIKDGNLIRFNNYEIASRVSYLLWGSMPDDKLFEAAGKGELSSPEQIATQARRLLADQRATDAIGDFHAQWLGIDGVEDMPKNPETFKVFTKELSHAMAVETREFVKSVFTGPGATGSLETLFTSNKTTVSPELAKLYGVTGSGNVTLDPAQRAGLFTQGAFLATKADADDSHPVKRGVTLLERVLCTELTPPQGVLIPPVADSSPDKTTRERFAMHSQGSCAACHSMIDPLGFAFENYDAVGAYRTTENGKQVDASGALKVGSLDVKFKNAIELLPALAKAPEAQACMATQWMRYGLRRHEAQGTDEKPSLDALMQTFKDSKFDMRELIVAVTKTRSFTHRTLSAGEVAQ
jgi:hypothetical protein